MNTKLQAIRALASKGTLDRYIVQGTSAEYLLTEELLEDALGFVRLVESGRIAGNLSESQRERLSELKAALLAIPAALEGEITSKHWAEARAAAERFVTACDHSE